MKIAFVVDKFPVLNQTFTLNQITGLLDRGHKVDIYALEGPRPDHIRFVQPLLKSHRLLGRTYYYPERISARWCLLFLKAHRVLFPGQEKELLKRWTEKSRRVKPPQSFLGNRSFSPSRRYDIIHCQFGNLGVRLLDLCEREHLTGKIVTSFRGADISMFVAKRGKDVYDQLFHRGDLFLPNCDYFKRLLIQLGCAEGKIRIQRSPMDCRAFPLTPRPAVNGQIRIVTTARLVQKKGLEYGIRAIAQLKRQHPKIVYRIIGEGGLRPALERIISELGLRDTVTLLGWRSSSEVAGILKDSHLFVAPSVKCDRGSEEGPVKTLKEAMAMGLPVVATRQGGIPELVEDGVSGFLVPERDSGAIAEKLEQLIQNPQLWPEMGRRGRAHVEEHYDKEKLNDELVWIYQELL